MLVLWRVMEVREGEVRTLCRVGVDLSDWNVWERRRGEN